MERKSLPPMSRLVTQQTASCRCTINNTQHCKNDHNYVHIIL